MGVATFVLVARMDYDAPVLPIARQVAPLRRVQAVNARVCGLSWWLMWVLVVVAVFGAQPRAAGVPVSAWLQATLWLGAVGLVASAVGLLWWHRRERAAGRQGMLDGSVALRQRAAAAARSVRAQGNLMRSAGGQAVRCQHTAAAVSWAPDFDGTFAL